MRGKITAALAATLLTITAGVLAQTSGFPSRPKFKSAAIGTPVPVLAGGYTLGVRGISHFGDPAQTEAPVLAEGAGSLNPQLIARGASVTVSNLAYIETQDANGAATLRIGDTSATDNHVTINAVATGTNINLVTSAAARVQANGFSIPRKWSGVSCTGAGGAGNATGGSCSRTGVGTYTVTFSQDMTGANCTVAIMDATAGMVKTTAAPTTTVAVSTFSTAGAAADLGWTINCFGP